MDGMGTWWCEEQRRFCQSWMDVVERIVLQEVLSAYQAQMEIEKDSREWIMGFGGNGTGATLNTNECAAKSTTARKIEVLWRY